MPSYDYYTQQIERSQALKLIDEYWSLLVIIRLALSNYVVLGLAIAHECLYLGETDDFP